MVHLNLDPLAGSNSDFVERVRRRGTQLAEALTTRNKTAIDAAWANLEYEYLESLRTMPTFTPDERIAEMGQTLINLIQNEMSDRVSEKDVLQPACNVGDYGTVPGRWGGERGRWRIVLHDKTTGEPTLDVLVGRWREGTNF